MKPILPLRHLCLLPLLLTGCSMLDDSSPLEQLLSYELPLLGHRNWIVVADSAYPAQARGGVETVYVGGDHLTAVERTLAAIERFPHVRPVVYLDAELDALAQSDAPGIDAFRSEVRRALAGRNPASAPHDELIGTLGETAQRFRVLVLKTDGTLPYSSVFFELDCGYWSPERELRLRKELEPSR